MGTRVDSPNRRMMISNFGDDDNTFTERQIANGNYGPGILDSITTNTQLTLECDFIGPSNPTNLGWDPVYSELQCCFRHNLSYKHNGCPTWSWTRPRALFQSSRDKTQQSNPDYLATCKGRNAIFRGKHVRATISQQSNSVMSFDEWKGADPLLFLGLSYTEVAGLEDRDHEKRAYFMTNFR